MEIEIRQMEPEDLIQVAAIEAENFTTPWSEQSFRDSLSRQDTIFLVAEAGGQIAGYIGMYISFGEGEITNVSVANGARRNGIGRRLVEELTDLARQQDMTSILLEVRKSNAGAILLYEKTGFQIIGERKDFYRFPTEDAYIMTINL